MDTNILITFLIGIGIGGFIAFMVSRLRQDFGQGMSLKDATGPGKEAEKILKKAGFKIISRSQKRTIITRIDGKDHAHYAEADFFVSSRGKRFAVLVSNRPGPADATEPNLRRELIELEHVFRPDGILLVDMYTKRLHEIGFNFPGKEGIDRIFYYIIAVILFLAVMGLVWLLFYFRIL